MIGIESFGGWTQAGRVIGLVLVEAIVLYVGYGLLESVVGPTITDAIRGD
ncbi:DUF7512 family protein [Natronomonas marina]|jgi:hypothetical protein|nr:hypothetical protein [Natronomonas marina]